MNSHPIRLLVADDHEVVRAGIRARLDDLEDIEIVGEAETGEEVLSLTQFSKIDVVLLDISMPILNGLETAQKLKERGDATKILMLSIYDAAEYVQGSLRSGASGYLLKDSTAEEMIAAIRSVGGGGMYFSAKVAQSLVSHGFAAQDPLKVNNRPCAYGLSGREREVLRAVAEGKPNKEIAEMLAISVRTVESHRQNIREKTGGGNAAHLTRIASELNLV